MQNEKFPSMKSPIIYPLLNSGHLFWKKLHTVQRDDFWDLLCSVRDVFI